MAQGHVEPPQNGDYKLSDKGRDLVRASAAGEVNRKTAEIALAGLLKRAEQYNSDWDKILTIDAVVVFGSFLSTKEKLGDLDVAVKCRDRDATNPDRTKTTLAYADRSGRHFGTFIDRICWPNTELCQILKARKRTIKIQDWDSFVGLVTENPARVKYKVIFGTSDKVDADIRARTEKKAGGPP
jgi:hypothetical protein